MRGEGEEIGGARRRPGEVERRRGEFELVSSLSTPQIPKFEHSVFLSHTQQHLPRRMHTYSSNSPLMSVHFLEESPIFHSPNHHLSFRTSTHQMTLPIKLYSCHLPSVLIQPSHFSLILKIVHSFFFVHCKIYQKYEK